MNARNSEQYPQTQQDYYADIEDTIELALITGFGSYSTDSIMRERGMCILVVTPSYFCTLIIQLVASNVHPNMFYCHLSPQQ